MIKGEKKRLFAFFVDNSGNPKEDLDITKIDFKVYYSDRSGSENPEVHSCSADNKGGFYSFEFEDVRHIDFGYVGHYSGSEGEFFNVHLVELENDPVESVNVGFYKLYGRAQINGVDSSDVRIRVFTSDQDEGYVRETSSGTTLYHYPEDSSKYYNWVLHLENPGTYVVELWKQGYISGTWSITITEEYSYFEDLILV